VVGRFLDEQCETGDAFQVRGRPLEEQIRSNSRTCSRVSQAPPFEAILREGFRDGPPYPDLLGISGVWLSNTALGCSEGAKGDVVLEVTVELSEEDLAVFELVEEGKTYREWCVPSGRLNGAAVVSLAGDVWEGCRATWPNPRRLSGQQESHLAAVAAPYVDFRMQEWGMDEQPRPT
jgi:hypothetical protein